MTDWDPHRYRRFETERTQPAVDLLSRVRRKTAKLVVDLGCGPGNSTELLAARFPEAEIIGIDTSPAMIETAQARLPHCRFAVADLAAWRPETPPDVIFANAVLQWLPDHAALLPRLMAHLPAAGTLAIQMPDNLGAPSHSLMRSVASQGPWADRLAPAAADRTILPPLDDYYDLLIRHAETVDVWRTTYHHPLASAAAIVDWVRSTGLRPFLNRLDPAEQEEFLKRYQASLEEAYPARADGLRLLGFERVFMVATRVG
ncbi:trans-aconitate 2-methyltransferase [Lichenifustis flavocetrariae]|uniref:Trans-aconitate 2-methyltransferase n=1 Tax=Lichenifustis flavocetrariae TaxID=2949735 RepID=A0AA42CM55_9HYPH|nr:trans-aconitate 2-methyltransferase [Lichenifustis flavocetrariae]MCW6508057.1 trans-aconitate 2-methyltransferase [Lichenifustis flavocetrariae]